MARDRAIVRFARQALLATGVVACGDRGPSGPAGPDPVLYETPRFIIADNAETPPAVVAAFGARLELEFDRVGESLPEFDPPPTPVPVVILPGEGIPFVTISENSLSQWRDRLQPEYIPHQLTHLYTGYGSTPFAEEGLAVYVTELRQGPGELPNPYRAQSPHAWVSLFERNGSTIPLFTALRAANLNYNYRGSSQDASAWQLFLQGGSFTRWMIETHGRDRWLVFYQTGNLAAALDQDRATVEWAWLDHVTSAVPDPLPCEEALVDVRAREVAWCARARGE